MGRMFRIITEGPIEAVTAGAALAHPRERDPFVRGEAPFIEVGGPTPVYHLPKSPAAEVTPAAKPVEYLSVSLQPFEPLSRGTACPIAASVVTYHQPNHVISAEYRAMAVEFRRQVGSGGSRAVLLTAAGRDRGTTTVLVNLAVTLADEARVLVIDADFEKPSAARMLGLNDIPGLGEALTQTTPLAWLLQPTVVTNLQALSVGTVTPATSFRDVPKILSQLRQWFDWILIDGGVWGERAERDAASPSFDALYTVRRENDGESLRPLIARHGGACRGQITTRI